jgi:acyl-coenzyme A synthetase/AMP-(fatty) acid ligase
VCRDAGAPLLVTERAHRPLAASLGLPAARVLDLDADPIRRDAARLDVAVTPDTLATILYTSGSTGEPKGVVQNHRGTLHDALHLRHHLRVGADDRVSIVLAWGAVGTVRDLVASLLGGASVYPGEIGTAGFRGVADWIERERISYVNLVVTLFRHLVAALGPDERLASVRVLRSGSESLGRADLLAFRRHFGPGCVLFGGFSATETGTATFAPIPADAEPRDGPIGAGAASDDYEVLVLDGSGRPVDRGEAGEIAFRSRYLAVGYWRRPDLTARAFLPDPEGGDARIYLSGDLGRVRPDGTLDLGGRRDSRVKIHGASVDPGEIEQALHAAPGVRQAAVVIRERKPGEPRLVAYVAPAPAARPTPVELRRHLFTQLPGYMIPATFVILPELPAGLTGKVDRRALPEPDWGQTTPFVAPRTEIEALLVRLWAEVLDATRIGVDHGFLDLGGNSLLALALMSRIREELHLDLPAADLLAAGTVAEMAIVVTAALADRLPAAERERLLGGSGLS